MQLTKLEHAALILETEGKKLFVDPGNMTRDLSDTSNTAGVVITHEHADHWTPEQLARILDANPSAPIFSTETVVTALRQAFPAAVAVVVRAGDRHQAGPFDLQFFGDEHAVIHSSIPVIKNVGVLINGSLYYGGDSLVPPAGMNGQIEVLAVPAGAPWLKIGEVIDYVLELKPRKSFGTHEMLLSALGKKLSADRIAAATAAGGGEYLDLQPGDVAQ